MCIYDGDKLIAVSYFDLGEQSMASLLGLYDHAYNKLSLGTYTMLKEPNTADAPAEWFTPGTSSTSPIDYKLKLGPMEHYTVNKRWAKLENFKPETTTSHHIHLATQALVKGFLTWACRPSRGCTPTSAWDTWGRGAFFLRLPAR